MITCDLKDRERTENNIYIKFNEQVRLPDGRWTIKTIVPQIKAHIENPAKLRQKILAIIKEGI